AGASGEFVAKAGTPFRSVGGRLRDCFQAETASVFAADFYGESIIEPKRLAQFEIKPPRVFGLDPVVDFGGVTRRLFFQNRGQGGAGVFGIDINAAAENCLLANIRSGEVEAALNWQVGFILDLLRHDFAEDELLGEILGADDDDVGAWRSAGGEEEQRSQSSDQS